MPTKKQSQLEKSLVEAARINARIAYMLKANSEWRHYIVITHGGQEFVGTKAYRYYANAVRFAKKMGFNVPVDGLDELMGK